jgi:hypothetical protein
LLKIFSERFLLKDSILKDSDRAKKSILKDSILKGSIDPANYLPRGKYQRQLSYGLVMGKFAHALAAVARPRLSNEDNASITWSKIQVAFNNVARSITGVRMRDHVHEDPRPAPPGRDHERQQDGGKGGISGGVDVQAQRRREERRQELRWLPLD